jgi:DNA (cytosine-5)-methyltransferase 1
MTLKILNLYAGIGGNRKLWNGDIEVTAIEYDPEIAKIYKHFFPMDNVIVTDAHAYLLEHYKEFDFIWSSPPCPSHSRIRKISKGSSGTQNEPIYPDMKLYEEILFLEGYFEGKWVVENVISWYEPLIKPFKVGSHFYWSNFVIPNKEDGSREHDSSIEILQKRKGFDLSSFKIKNDKKKILRNCVEPEMGLYIFNCAYKDKQVTLL